MGDLSNPGIPRSTVSGGNKADGMLVDIVQNCFLIQCVQWARRKGV